MDIKRLEAALLAAGIPVRLDEAGGVTEEIVAARIGAAVKKLLIADVRLDVGPRIVELRPREDVGLRAVELRPREDVGPRAVELRPREDVGPRVAELRPREDVGGRDASDDNKGPDGEGVV